MKKYSLLICLIVLMFLSSCTITKNTDECLIDLKVDTKNIVIETSDLPWYKSSIKNSSDLLDIIITIEITDNNYLNKDYKIVVNGDEITKEKITIDKNIIKVTIDDPNWSDFI